MERLTKKTWGGYKPAQEEDDWDGCDYNEYIEGKILPKLGKLEDIEGELGIDLITLFKALRSEYIFIKRDGKIYEYGVALEININGNGWFFDLEVCHFGIVYFKDYGKTWALTKEELE